MKNLHKRTSEKTVARFVRHKRVRKKIVGTPERPRLAVFRSNLHIYVQIIDDVNGKTLLAASTLTPAVKEKMTVTSNKDAAKAVGMAVAEMAKSKGITAVVFDRGGFLFHGRIKALADGAREGGLQF